MAQTCPWVILSAPPLAGVAALEHKQALIAAVLDVISGLSADSTQPSTACDRGFAYLRAALRKRPGTDALRTPRALRLCLKWAARWDSAASADASGGEALRCLNNALFRCTPAQRAMAGDSELVASLASLLGTGAAGTDSEATARVCRNLVCLFALPGESARLGEMLYRDCALVEALLPRLEAGVALIGSIEERTVVVERWPSAAVHRVFVDALLLLNAVAGGLASASDGGDDAFFGEDGADDADSPMSRLGRLLLAVLLHPRRGRGEGEGEGVGAAAEGAAGGAAASEEGEARADEEDGGSLLDEVQLAVCALLMRMPPRYAHFLAAHGAVGALGALLGAQSAAAARASAMHAREKRAASRERLTLAMGSLACVGAVCALAARESLAARRELKHAVFPDEEGAAAVAAAARAGDGMHPADAPRGTLRATLISLMNGATFSSARLVVADLLYVLCDEDHHEMVARTGVGAAAGLLAARGLFKDFNL